MSKRFWRRAVMSAIAIVPLAIATPVGAATPPSYSGGELAAGYKTSFYRMWAWCDNPQFSNRTDDGTGTWWGIFSHDQLTGTPTYHTWVGYTIGSFSGTAYTGQAVDNEVSGTTLSDTLYAVNSSPPTGNYSLEDMAESTTSALHDVYINGTKVVSGINQGTALSQEMFGILSDRSSTYPDSTAQFPNFVSGDGCSGLQTFYTAWANWPSSATIDSIDGPPPGESTAHYTYTNTGTANYLYFYQ